MPPKMPSPPGRRGGHEIQWAAFACRGPGERRRARGSAPRAILPHRLYFKRCVAFQELPRLREKTMPNAIKWEEPLAQPAPRTPAPSKQAAVCQKRPHAKPGARRQRGKVTPPWPTDDATECKGDGGGDELSTTGSTDASKRTGTQLWSHRRAGPPTAKPNKRRSKRQASTTKSWTRKRQKQGKHGSMCMPTVGNVNLREGWQPCIAHVTINGRVVGACCHR